MCQWTNFTFPATSAACAGQIKKALQIGSYQSPSWYWTTAWQAVGCNHLCSFLCMFRKGFTLSFQRFYKSSRLGPAFFCGKLTKLDSHWTCKPWPHSYFTWATLRSWFFWCLFFLIWNNSYFSLRKPCLLMTASCNMLAAILRSSPMALSHLIHHPQTWGQKLPWSGGKTKLLRNWIVFLKNFVLRLAVEASVAQMVFSPVGKET